MPVPGFGRAAQKHLAPRPRRPMHIRGAGVRPEPRGHENQIALGPNFSGLAGLLPALRALIAVTEANAPLLISTTHQGCETEATATLNDLGQRGLMCTSLSTTIPLSRIFVYTAVVRRPTSSLACAHFSLFFSGINRLVDLRS